VRKIHFFYAFACILDPRDKMSKLAIVLSQLCYAFNVSYDQPFLEVKDNFVEVYGKYEV
jgi:hypothetical protein